MNLINPNQELEDRKLPLKKSKTGLEIEFHIIDAKGKISHKALEVIKDLEEVPSVQVTKEFGKNIVEFLCYPDVATYNPPIDIISSIQRGLEVGEKHGVTFYPFATYPGKFTPEFTPLPRYELIGKIFGEKAVNNCYATGFHHHYTLPKGVFDLSTKNFRIMRRSKLTRSMMSAYNFEIAADPVLALFTQSSPFHQGKHLAKDTRMLIYRGGKKLDYMEGLYANHQQLGGLPPYKQTATDLMTSIQKRQKRWEDMMQEFAPGENIDEHYPNKLDITWNPVKINKHGTLEQRGMDSNYLSTVTAVTVLLKFCLRKIQRHFIEVMPADFAVNEPFKLENGILYVPPHTVVRDELQVKSAYQGFADPQMYNYAKRFFTLAQSVTPKRYSSIIKPVKEMIESKKSMSDKIIAYTKRKGYFDGNSINNADGAELALYYANKLPKDLENTKKKLERLSGV